MSELRKQIDELRARFAPGSSQPPREWCLERLEVMAKLVEAHAAQTERQRLEVEEAEHARDAANLARMRVFGQLSTLQKSIRALTPDFDGAKAGDAQHGALRRVEWLSTRSGVDPKSAMAAQEAEMEAPMPGRAVLEAVVAGERTFTKVQLEFSVSEAMVLTGWEMSPLEIMEKGQPWLAQLILKTHAES